MTWETVKTDSEEHREKQVTPDKDAASPGRAGGPVEQADCSCCHQLSLSFTMRLTFVDRASLMPAMPENRLSSQT